MSSFQKMILVGHLGADPEVRYTQGGKAVANIRVATTDKWRDKQSGEPRERTEWHRIVLFGRNAEIAGKYLTEGSQVGIQGKNQTRKWQAQDGSDRYTTEIVADDLTLMGGGRRANTSGQDDPPANAGEGFPDDGDGFPDDEPTYL